MADQLLTGTTLVENTSRSDGDVPVGGIIPWLKSFTGTPNLPQGWMECDGSTVNDPLSSLNGQTLPDLNGDNRFLRGNSTSGGTGGSLTNTAVLHSPSNFSAGGGASDVVANGSDNGTLASGILTGSGTTWYRRTSTTNSFSIVPPYYNVVWIIRIK
jgi:hypothetical protein